MTDGLLASQNLTLGRSPVQRGDFVLRPFLASCDRTALLVLFLARCFALMHDSGHGSLFRRRAANRIAGFLFGIVCALAQLPWSRGHAFHHRHNGDWELYQGPAALITTEAYRNLSPQRQRLYRWLRHPWMLAPGGFFYLVIKPRLTLLQALAGLVAHAVSSLQRSPTMAMGEVIATYRSRHWHSLEEGLDLVLNNLAVIGLWLLMGFAIGRNAPLPRGVTRIGLADLHRCFDYILWDPDRSRLTTAADA